MERDIEAGIELEIVHPHAELITPKYDPMWAQHALQLIEECGRVSHKSEGRITLTSAEPFVRKIAIEYGHESIIEHAVFTACLIGSRAMSHQLVRHRLAAYTQESQRYCDYAGDAHPRLKVIVPPSIASYPAGSIISVEGGWRLVYRVPGDPHPHLVERGNPFFERVLDNYATYCAMREDKVPAEDARHVLPNATKTEVYTTFNLRQWRHFFHMRLDKHAQWEIKICAQQVYDYFKQTIPVIVENLTTHSGERL